MNHEENLKELVKNGFSAMLAGSKIAAKATASIQSMAKNEELKQALQQGNTQSKEWVERIETGLKEIGGSAEEKNEIVEAHVTVGQQIMEKASDDYSRDLGIIAAGQLALHYWIGSFGIQKTYAEASGLTEAATNMQKCMEEAKAADEKYTQIAAHIFSAN